MRPVLKGGLQPRICIHACWLQRSAASVCAAGDAQESGRAQRLLRRWTAAMLRFRGWLAKGRYGCSQPKESRCTPSRGVWGMHPRWWWLGAEIRAAALTGRGRRIPEIRQKSNFDSGAAWQAPAESIAVIRRVCRQQSRRPRRLKTLSR